MLLPQRDGGVDAPAFLADRGLLAAGALVATLVSHRRDWVDRHIEAIRLLASNRARREVTVAFKLPRIAWAMASADAPVLIPLALLPKEGTSNLTVEDEHPGDGAD